MSLDFTLKKYEELCDVISKSGYASLTTKEYVSSNVKPKKFIIIRHDIDSGPEYALKVAEIECKFHIKSTHYFRFIEGIFLPDLIRKIANMGHEIGYHYEVLDKARGKHDIAIKIFEKELNEFREIYDIKTIAQHGSPLLGNLNATSFSGVFNIFKAILNKEDIFTNWVNLELWNKYDFKDFDILGEAYLSIDYNKTLYLSDTGRSWDNSKYKMKDLIPNSGNTNFQLNIKTTDDIINMIRNESVDSMCILVHPIQWKESLKEWLSWLIFLQIRNNGKLLLKTFSKKNNN